VAKNLSSRSPIWSRTTATNHRNVIPANGPRYSPPTTIDRSPPCAKSRTSVLSSWAINGDVRSSSIAAVNMIANRIPATLAAHGAWTGRGCGAC
jgi:hypothetical protein